jgi:hypothetical protein
MFTRTLLLTLTLAGAAALTPLAAQQAAPVGVSRAALAPAAVLAMSPTAALADAAPSPLADGNFGESGFSQFMASPAGRVLRVVAGAAMIGGGIALDSGAGTALAVVGALPLSAGALDLCYVSGLLGGPWKGSEIRAMGKGK